MGRSRALALLCLAVTAATTSHARRAQAPRCDEGTWTIDGGPATIGPLEIHVLTVTTGVPSLGRLCSATHWRDLPTGELRALFACRNPEQGLHDRFFLQLRARSSDACLHMSGTVTIRSMGMIAQFTATRTGAPCTYDDHCTAEAFCQRPVGECTAEGQCSARPWECFGDFKPACGCDGRNHTFCDAVSFADFYPCPCGGAAELGCSEGETCELPAGTCGGSDVEGECVSISACSRQSVCGCDGVTYANDCLRRTAGAQKAYDGPCAD